MKKRLSWFLRLLKNMGSSRISGICVKVLIGPAACCLEKEWFPSCERSVQSSLLSSGGAGSAPLHGWVTGQQQQEVMPGRSAALTTGTGPARERISLERAEKKIGFYIFGQGSCFEYIWLNRIFHFTVLIINHTHWINAIFVIPLKCNFFCTVSELHDRCNILSLCSW